ncbi:MAG: RrF2 family transcriptional regulator [Candidatus Aminicenantes bacterium]|nr:MAG: RrF2 family transcriptional regulator [Candidatus Aminicenantes bacterium]
MKLSTKARYGARAMLELALNYEKGSLLLREIAQRQEISHRYLERIMNVLVSAGLVRSSRGQHGGFSLAKSPGEIRLSQVIQAVEGSIAPTSCVDDPKICNRVDICITRDIWEKLKKAMLEVLDSITLDNMIEMQKKKLAKPKGRMYYI